MAKKTAKKTVKRGRGRPALKDAKRVHIAFRVSPKVYAAAAEVEDPAQLSRSLLIQYLINAGRLPAEGAK